MLVSGEAIVGVVGWECLIARDLSSGYAKSRACLQHMASPRFYDGENHKVACERVCAQSWSRTRHPGCWAWSRVDSTIMRTESAR
jgi:hypothetical protein